MAGYPKAFAAGVLQTMPGCTRRASWVAQVSPSVLINISITYFTHTQEDMVGGLTLTTIPMTLITLHSCIRYVRSPSHGASSPVFRHRPIARARGR
jgi:hypothetical protein